MSATSPASALSRSLRVRYGKRLGVSTEEDPRAVKAIPVCEICPFILPKTTPYETGHEIFMPIQNSAKTTVRVIVFDLKPLRIRELARTMQRSDTLRSMR
jgi:hypothetical protein